MDPSVKKMCSCGNLVPITEADFDGCARNGKGCSSSSIGAFSRDYKAQCGCGRFVFHSTPIEESEYHAWKQAEDAKPQLALVAAAG